MTSKYFIIICIVLCVLSCKTKQEIVKAPDTTEVKTEVSKEGELPKSISPDCFDVTKKDHLKECEKTIDYVCGCDGKTYLNVCEAEKAGLNKMKKGRCLKTAEM